MPRFASRVRVWGCFCGHMPRSAPRVRVWGRFCGHMPRSASRVRVWGLIYGYAPRNYLVSAFEADFTDTHTDIAFVSVEKG